jgi:hypothetical protein
MCGVRRTWLQDKAPLPPPTFRKSSTTMALSGTTGQAHWPTWEWVAPTLCNPEPGLTAAPSDADAARVRALTVYRAFLTLWKDADPDIPVLKRAKAEYAKLQLSPQHFRRTRHSEAPMPVD